MYRWYGNNLRQNSRALKLGARRLGWFTMLVLFDQRVSMWTSLLGLVVAILASLRTASPSCWCTCSGSASPAWC